MSAAVLTALSEADRADRFHVLQARMPDVWGAMRRDLPGESVVVVPSVTLDTVGERSGSMQQAYEERFLFMLLLLRQPALELVYVTSMPVQPAVVEYYLGLLPGVIPSHARRRLHLVSVGDSGARPLSEKLLDRPRLLRRIRDLVPDRARSHLVPYVTTSLERDLALALGIPMYGADPRLLPFGTKTGCRRLFAAEGVTHPLGVEDVRTIDDVIAGLRTIRARRPDVRRALVKLDEGVSGSGNATVELADLPAVGSPDEGPALRRAVDAMVLENPSVPREGYLAKLAERGGIVEERIEGREVRSPSVQLRTTPAGEVELLSTHDQLLGGPSGQAYLGCVFPADPAYATRIAAPAQRIGERLAREGVLGRFALDFVVVRRDDGSWDPYAIELNLRKGGTTHPFLTLQFLTGGAYDAETATYRTAVGAEKHLVATDHLESDALRALSVDDLFGLVARARLHFDQTRQTGVVLHMLSCLTEHGRVGLTAVADSRADAAALHRHAESVLLEEAEAAGRPLEVPG